MPRGDKSAYTDKQKRQAEHIEESYESRGVKHDVAEARAWATVNKQSGGGNLSGSGRGVPDTHVSARKGGRLGGQGLRAAIRCRTICLGEEGGRNAQAQCGSGCFSPLACGQRPR